MEVNSAAAHSGTLPLFRHLQPRAKWAVVQHCRPASACRFSSHSVAATVAQTYEQFCRALLTPSPRASIALCLHTRSHSQSHTRSSQADDTIRRHTLTRNFTLANNHHRGHCSPIVRYLFLGTFRHLHLSLIGSHCCCRQSADQTSTLMP